MTRRIQGLGSGNQSICVFPDSVARLHAAHQADITFSMRRPVTAVRPSAPRPITAWKANTALSITRCGKGSSLATGVANMVHSMREDAGWGSLMQKATKAAITPETRLW